MAIFDGLNTDDPEFTRYIRPTNFERATRAMRTLVRRQRFFECRPHIPMVGPLVCIGASTGSVAMEQTACLSVQLSDDVAHFGVTDIRRDDDGRLIRAGLIRYEGSVPPRTLIEGPLGGFAVDVYRNGHHELVGVEGRDTIVLPDVTVEDADAYALGCLFALERRADAKRIGPITRIG